MVSSLYLFSIAASCFILMQVCSSMVVAEQYPSLMRIDNNDDQALIQQRLAHLLYSLTSLNNRLNKRDNDQDFHPPKREQFGRKHHWDVFFGRR